MPLFQSKRGRGPYYQWERILFSFLHDDDDDDNDNDCNIYSLYRTSSHEKNSLPTVLAGKRLTKD